MNIPQLVLSMLIFLVMFFGIGFLLNMLLRSTWLMAFIYPIVVLIIVNQSPFGSYLTQPMLEIQNLGTALVELKLVDHLVLSFGLIGSIVAGIVIKMLRVRGYQMF
ncbi:YuiB family protein [Alkalicoccobacillus porphyridii]|uniref:YuiB family protein n=1 Tax=Alkalicoccobacillus porphyridii TaxID=2597270 RepID=A0A554A3D8_9BACI|nr:YuiB family protein [Alkalicoccobacillus porphyridii]TSB48195.1 hypothetical protein FN960_01180 [Alkalicoccobacillus porphyridii]